MVSGNEFAAGCAGAEIFANIQKRHACGGEQQNRS
jgi:hypothetical protein